MRALGFTIHSAMALGFVLVVLAAWAEIRSGNHRALQPDCGLIDR